MSAFSFNTSDERSGEKAVQKELKKGKKGTKGIKTQPKRREKKPSEFEVFAKREANRFKQRYPFLSQKQLKGKMRDFWEKDQQIDRKRKKKDQQQVEEDEEGMEVEQEEKADIVPLKKDLEECEPREAASSSTSTTPSSSSVNWSLDAPLIGTSAGPPSIWSAKKCSTPSILKQRPTEERAGGGGGGGGRRRGREVQKSISFDSQINIRYLKDENQHSDGVYFDIIDREEEPRLLIYPNNQANSRVTSPTVSNILKRKLKNIENLKM